MDAPPPHTLSAHQKHQVHITTSQTTQRDGLVLAHRCRIALAVVLLGKAIGHRKAVQSKLLKLKLYVVPT